MDAERNTTLDAIVRYLTLAKRLFLVPHIQPDGDCVGSTLGLAWALRQMGKEVSLALDDHLPSTFEYLPGYEELKFKEPGDPDLIVLLDGSDRTRFGRLYDLARATGKPVIQIDHHATNDMFADVNWVDSHTGSCAELVYRLVRRLPVNIDETIASCLLTGILTDTLVFRTSNTTPETLLTSVELVRAGASIPFIVDRVYNRRPFNTLHLLGHVLGRSRLEGPVIWSQVTQQDLKSFGLNGGSSAGIINMLLTVEQAQVAVLLTERDDGRVEVGLRARQGHDVSQIAYSLGGGGHKQAAGAVVVGPLEEARGRVLEQVKRHMSRNGSS